MAQSLRLAPLDTLSRDQLLNILEIRNRDGVRTNMYNTHVIAEAEHFAWVERTQNDPSVRFFAVFQEEALVGAVSLNAWSAANRRSDWAFYLDPDIQGKGLGAALEYRFLCHAFGEFDLLKLNCEVLDFNEKVVSLHKKFGFREEGFRRDHILREDGPHGVYLLGLTRADWDAKKAELDRTLFKQGA